VRIESPDTDAADRIADLWVRLAEDQQQHGSHLKSEANREDITENITRSIVGDGLRVARAEADDDVESGTVLGFVMFTIDIGPFETDVTRGTIENIYVEPEYRNQGVGAALLSAAEDALAERGADVVKLEVMGNNEDARRFYGGRGYEPHRVQLEKPIESDND
jgi:ribosomal protein S18 acetylase RimI-like enzyme